MPAEDTIRSFEAGFPEAELTELRRRITATRWPDRETVGDDSQGVRLAMLQELARYWGTDYDWRKCEASLNALPNFITGIDGLDIHFIHVRSQHEDALPMIVTHGWPGSIIEQMKIIEPLTDPTAHGGSASDAFHLVIPSLPGHGFSAKPTATGWDPVRIAQAWVVLMFQTSCIRHHAAGRSVRIPRTLSTTTSSIAAATSPPGNSPTSSPPRCGRPSEHCASRTRTSGASATRRARPTRHRPVPGPTSNTGRAVL